MCGEDFVGETIRNNATRWSEYSNPTHKSEPAQHIKKHIRHLLFLFRTLSLTNILITTTRYALAKSYNITNLKKHRNKD